MDHPLPPAQAHQRTSSTSRRGQAGRNNQVYLATRLVSLGIIPFLLAAFGILYVFPDHTKALFAWEIHPRMTAMMLGGVYFGGAYFFARAASSTHWHRITCGFLPVTTFAALLGLATILHWDVFNHQHLSFYTWAALYFTTPFLILGLWLWNRRTDPGVPEANERPLPWQFRWVHGCSGVLALATSIPLLLSLSFVLDAWPWHLTPLTGQVVGSMLALTGVGEIGLTLERRWSAVRIALHSQIITLVGIDLAMLFSWSSFQQANPFTWLFSGGTFFLLLISVVFYWWLERHQHQAEQDAPASGRA